MKVFTYTYTGVNPKLHNPVKDTMKVEGPSLSQVLSRSRFSGKQKCDLKNYGKTEWIDDKGTTHTIEIQERPWSS
jgi:hypothetical protein